MSTQEPILQFMLFSVILFIYFLPALNAFSRNHRNNASIFLTNLLLGWTLLGWIIALIWSASADVEPQGRSI